MALKEQPQCILFSRMLRSWKPFEEVKAPPKAKSRWCVRGHEEPMTVR